MHHIYIYVIHKTIIYIYSYRMIIKFVGHWWLFFLRVWDFSKYPGGFEPTVMGGTSWRFGVVSGIPIFFCNIQGGPLPIIS